MYELVVRFDGVGFAEELDDDGDVVDSAGPAEAGLGVEAAAFEVGLQRLIGLRDGVAEGESDDQVDVGCADVRRLSFGESADEVAGCESAGALDPFAPRADVTEQGDQGAFAAGGGLLVVVAEAVAAHGCRISCRSRSACSRPRRGSRRRS